MKVRTLAAIVVIGLVVTALAGSAEAEPHAVELTTNKTRVKAGEELRLTVRILDKKGNPLPFLGAVELSTGDKRSTIPGTILEFTGEDEGVVDVKLGTVGSQQITAQAYPSSSDETKDSPKLKKDSVTIAVEPGAPSELVISTVSTVEAGSPLELRVTSQDEFGNHSPVDTTAEAQVASETVLFSLRDGRGKATLVPTQSGLIKLEVASVSLPGLFGSTLVEVLATSPALLAIASGDGQLIDRGKSASSPFTVVVADRYGNPVRDVTVSYSVTSGGVGFDGSLTSSDRSDGEGLARSDLAHGGLLGLFEVTASSAGLPSVTFKGEVVQRATGFTFTGIPAVVVAGEPLPTVEITAVDHLGDLVPTVSGVTTVRLTGTDAPNGTATFPSEIAVTFSGGRATLMGVTFARSGDERIDVRHPTRLEISTTKTVAVLAAGKVALKADQPSITENAGTSKTLSGSVVDRFGNTVPEEGISVVLKLSEFSEIPGRFLVGPTHDTRRMGAKAARLGDGKVMIAGGEDDVGTPILPTIIYHPATHTFHPGPSLIGHRRKHTVTSLPDGGVLVFGGAGFGAPVAERYDPVAGAFHPLSGPTSRSGHTATPLPDGKVLIVGGHDAGGIPTGTTVIFDPSSEEFHPGPMLPGPLVGHAAIATSDGVVILGGSDGGFGASLAVLFFKADTGELTSLGSLSKTRTEFEAVLLDATSVLVWGGKTDFLLPLKDGEVFDLSSGTATPAGETPELLTGARLSRLKEGKAILTGGGVASGFPPETEGKTVSFLFDKATGTFEPGPALSQPRFDHIVFPSTPDSGEIVLVCGGPLESEFYVATFSTKGTFVDGTRETTVVTGGDGRFELVFLVGHGEQVISATSSSLASASFTVQGDTVPQKLVGLAFEGLPPSVATGESFTGTLVAVDHTGARVDYSGLAEVRLDGAGAFPDTLLVSFVGGTASLGEMKLAQSGPRELVARLVENSSVLGVSDPIEVLPSDAGALVVVSGSGQDLLASSGLGRPVLVKVLDRFGNPVPGAAVKVTADRGSFGAATEAEIVSDGAGQASLSTYVAPAEAGVDVLHFTLPDEPATEITAGLLVVSPVAPDKLEAVTAVYSGLVGSDVPMSFRATSAGRPVGGYEIHFRVVTGDAVLGTISAVTDASGIATVVAKSSTFERARVEASTGTLTAMADVLFAPEGVPVSVSVDAPESIEAGSPFSLTIRLTDALGALASGTHMISLTLTGATSPDGTEFPDSIDVLVTDGVATVDGIVLGSTSSSLEVHHVGEVKSPPAPIAISGLLSLLRFVTVSGPPHSVMVAGDSSRDAIPGELLDGVFFVFVLDKLGNPVSNEDVSFQFADGDSYFDQVKVPWQTVLSNAGGLAAAPSIRVGQTLGTHALWAGAGPDRKTLTLRVKHTMLELTPDSTVEASVVEGVEYRLLRGMPGEMLSRPADGEHPHLGVTLRIKEVGDEKSKAGVAGLTVEYTVMDEPGKKDVTEEGHFHKTATFYRVRVRESAPAPPPASGPIPIGFLDAGRGATPGEVIITPGGGPQMEQFEELGPRVIVEASRDGKAGGELLLRLPRELVYDEEGGEWKAWVRIRVRVLAGLGRTSSTGPGVYPTIYLRIPIRPPVIRAKRHWPDDKPLAFVAGSSSDVITTTSSLYRFKLVRKAVEDDAFGGTPLPNHKLFARVRKKADKSSADEHFFFNWRTATTHTDPTGERGLIVLPRRSAEAGEYQVVVGTTPDADPDAPLADKNNRTHAFAFDLTVLEKYPRGLEPNFHGRSMIASGGFQRLNVAKENLEGARAMPSPVKLDFAAGGVNVAKQYDAEETYLTNVLTGESTIEKKSLAPKGGAYTTHLGRAPQLAPFRSWVAKVTEKLEEEEEGTRAPRVRREAIVALADWRARVVRKKEDGTFVPVRGPLFATEVVDTETGKLSVSTPDELEFYIEVTSGDLGKIEPKIAAQGLPYLGLRTLESAAVREAGFRPKSYLESGSALLQRFGVGRAVDYLPLGEEEPDRPKEGEPKTAGRIIYRFGPYRLTHQLYGSLDKPSLLDSSGEKVHILQAGRGLIYNLIGSVGVNTGIRSELPTMAHDVRSLRLIASNGTRNVPGLRDFVPRVVLVSEPTVDVSGTTELDIEVLDQFADLVGKHESTAPSEIYVQYQQGAFVSEPKRYRLLTEQTKPIKPEAWRPFPFKGRAPIEVKGADKAPVTRVTVSVTNKLGTLGQLVFELRRASEGKATVHVVRRCRSAHPSIYYASYEPPGVKDLPESEDGEGNKTPHKFLTTTVRNIDGKGGVPLVMTQLLPEREYRSTPFLVIRAQEVPTALKAVGGLPVVWVSGDRERVQLRTYAAPLLPLGRPFTHTIVSRPVPTAWVYEDPAGTARHATDVVRDGDRFEIRYTPDYRVDPSKTTIKVLVSARLSDGSPDPKNKVLLELVRDADLPDRFQFTSTASVLVSGDPSFVAVAGSKLLRIPGATAQLVIEVVDREQDFELPVVSEIVRVDGDEKNPPEALSGNSPQAGFGVYVHNQEQVLRLPLHGVRGRAGMDYRLALTHRTRIRTTSSVGASWTHNYDLRLRRVRVPTSKEGEYKEEFHFYNGDARYIRFAKTGTGWDPEPGAYMKLSAIATGYEITGAAGTKIIFTSKEVGGYLLASRIKDPNDNTIEFRYGARGRLAEVIDSLGRSYFYRYDKRGLLREVADFTGRRFVFQFSQVSPLDLQRIDFPRVRRGIIGGTAESYVEFRYRSHRLVTYKDRQGVTLFTNKVGAGGRIVRQSMPSATRMYVALDWSRTSAGGNVGVTNGRGKRTAYAFGGPDPLGRSLALRVKPPGIPATIFTYNEEGEYETVTPPNGGTTTFAYEETAAHRRKGNLVRITQSRGKVSIPAVAPGYPTGYHEKAKAHAASTAVVADLVTQFKDYNEFGKAELVIRPDGTRTTRDYDTRGNLLMQTHAAVKTASVSEAGVVSIVGEKSGTERWTYNAAGQVISHTDVMRRVVRYHYYKLRHTQTSGDDVARALAGGSPRIPGATATPTTDSMLARPGYLARIHDVSQGSERSLARDERGNTTALVDERRVVHRFYFNERDELVESRPADAWVGAAGDGSGLGAGIFAATARPVIYHRYDLAGNRREVVARERGGGGSATQLYVPDELGRVKKISRQIAGAKYATTRYERDAAGNLEKIFGPSGRVRIFEYDDAGRKTAETVRLKDSSSGVRVEIGLDDDGNVVSRKVDGDDVKRAALFYYDAHGRAVASLQPGGVVNLVTPDLVGRPRDLQAWGRGSRYKGGSGDLASRFEIIELMRLSWEKREYNDRGWLIVKRQKVRADSTSDKTWLRRELRYNLAGELVSQKSLPRGGEVARHYDGRRVRWVFRNAGAQIGAHKIRFDYDRAGNVLARTEHSLDVLKGSTTTYRTDQGFDGMGRRIAFTPPDGRTTRLTHSWQGYLEQLNSPLEERYFKTDLLGRRTHVYRGEDASGSLLAVTSYFDDGSVKSRTSAIGGTTKYKYTATGQVEEITHPLTKNNPGAPAVSHKFKATYTGSGKLDTTTDPNGTTVKYTVDDAGRVVGREVARLGKGEWGVVWGAGKHRVERDGLGRPIHALAVSGQAADRLAYDGVGRTLAEGTSFAPPSVAGYPTSRFPRRVERLVLTSYDDAAGSRTETLPFSGLTVVHTREEAQLTGRWEATGLGMQGATVSHSDGRLQRIDLGKPGKLVARTSYGYKTGTREFTELRLRYNGAQSIAEERVFSRTPDAENGLVRVRSQDIGERQCTSTSDYTLGHPELIEIEENCQQHLRGSDWLHSRRNTYGVRRDPAGNQLAATVYLQRWIPRKQRISTTMTFSRPQGSVDAAGRYLRGVRKVDQIVEKGGRITSISSRTDKSTLEYDNAGGLVKFVEFEEGSKDPSSRGIGLARDAYGRLRQVTRTDDVPGGVVEVRAPGKGSTESTIEYVERTTRRTTSRYWYSPLGKRLHKFSTLSLRRRMASDSRKHDLDIRQVKGEWYTVGAGGLVHEETSYILQGKDETPHLVHRGFVVDRGKHAALLRWEAPGTSLGGPGKGATELWSQHYILRNDQGNPHVLVGLNGQSAGQIDLGYDGELLGLPTGDSPVNLSYENPRALNYHYLLGGRKLDIETGFYDFGKRYYWPELGRYLSPNPAGTWADPASLGNPYTFAGNNPLLNIQPPGGTPGPYPLADPPVPGESGGLLHNTLSILQVMGGVGEVGLGVMAALASPLTGGGSLAVGGLLILHGLDQIQTGARSLYTGRAEQSLVSMGIQKAFGASRLQADLADAGIGLALTLGANSVIKAGQATARRAARTARRELRSAADDAVEAGSSACFVAGTQVKTKRGTKSIEDIEAGDWVWARDDKSGNEGWKRVKRTFVSHPTELIKLTARPLCRAREKRSAASTRPRRTDREDDASGCPEGSTACAAGAHGKPIEITGTAEHPFWSTTRQDWVVLGELQVGDRLFLADGREAVVEVLEQRRAPEGAQFTTYNFEVEDWHTYFVGDDVVGWVWVHNACLEEEIRALRRIGARQRASREGGGALSAAGDDSVVLYHGTSSNRASKIVGNEFYPTRGFRSGSAFLAEEFETAAVFAHQSISQFPRGATLPRSFSVIEFRMPRALADELGIGLAGRSPIGRVAGAKFVDVGSGFERVLVGQNVERFNEALHRGLIQARRARLR